jgi:transposase
MTGDTRAARRRAIQACWLAGMSLREIAGLLNTTPESICTAVYRMRRDGWDMPYGRPDLASPGRPLARRAPEAALGGRDA